MHVAMSCNCNTPSLTASFKCSSLFTREKEKVSTATMTSKLTFSAAIKTIITISILQLNNIACGSKQYLVNCCVIFLLSQYMCCIPSLFHSIFHLFNGALPHYSVGVEDELLLTNWLSYRLATAEIVAVSPPICSSFCLRKCHVNNLSQWMMRGRYGLQDRCSTHQIKAIIAMMTIRHLTGFRFMHILFNAFFAKNKNK